MTSEMEKEWMESEEYDRLMREIAEEEDEYKSALVRDNIHRARLDRFKDESTELTEWERTFHIIKLWICYVLGWGWEPKHGQYPDALCAVLIAHRPTYGGWEEDWIEVGHGFFRNWFYQLEHDSDWTM